MPTDAAGLAGRSAQRDVILLVDDDDLIRKGVAAVLRRLGYEVIAAANGPKAIDLVASEPDRFAAVLLDLMMPGMNGREVFHALAALRADLPVVVCTGMGRADDLDEAMRRGIAGFLLKPFTARALSDALLSAGAKPSHPSGRELGGPPE